MNKKFIILYPTFNHPTAGLCCGLMLKWGHFKMCMLAKNPNCYCQPHPPFNILN